MIHAVALTDCGVKQRHNASHVEELLVLLAIGQPIQVLVSTAQIIQNVYFALKLFQSICTLLSIRNGLVHVDKTVRKLRNSVSIGNNYFQ